MKKVKIIFMMIGLMGVVWANRLDDPKDSLEVVGSLEFPGNPARSLFVRDSFAYVACDSTYGPPRGLRLFVVNVSNPALPETVGSCFMSGSPRGIWVKDSIAYIAAGLAGMQIVNVSDPKSPKLIGSLNSGVLEVQVVDSFSYLSEGDSGLFIVNVSNPLEPKFAGRLYPPGCGDLSIQSPYAYALKRVGESGFNIINISNPAHLYIVGGAGDGYSEITVNGNYAYTGWLEFLVVDVSDSIQPKTIAVYPKEFGPICSIFIDSVYTYIAAWYSMDVPEALCGLLVLNVSNPSQPTLSARYGGGYDKAQDVFVKDRLVYTCFNYGLLILRHIVTGVEEEPKKKLITPKFLSNFPNPFNRSTKIRLELSLSGFVDLKIYDVSGRLVRTLIQAQMTAGRYTLYWNGRNDRGIPLPIGVYFIYLNTAGLSLTKKAILLR